MSILVIKYFNSTFYTSKNDRDAPAIEELCSPYQGQNDYLECSSCRMRHYGSTWQTCIAYYSMMRDITAQQYEAALQRVEELLPLVSDETPDPDKNLIELLEVSAIVEAYEDIHYPIGGATND